MKDLLLLVQRCPYPPNKGDKIASWHLLKYLAARYAVHLGTYIDDPHDWQYANVLRQHCASTYLAGLRPDWSKVKSLTGFVTGEALSVAYYRHAGMQRWVDARLNQGVERIVVFSSAMARYVTQAEDRIRVMDFVDLDSDKWLQYARASRWPMSWVYRREGQRLLQWERRIAAGFDASLFVTEAEAADFRRLAPESAAKVGVLSNGVDAEYFTPAADYPNPFAPNGKQIVFTGAMDYRPNIDAVVWFAREALPLIQRRQPDAGFCIVGSRPGPDVRALEQLPGVLVTGRVDDVRPYLAHAAVVVAPLRMARGIQNKVIEGMAMGRTVVCSPQGHAGISAVDGEEVLVADGPQAFADSCLRVLDGLDLGPAARQRVLADYDWDARLARLDTLLADDTPRAGDRTRTAALMGTARA